MKLSEAMRKGIEVTEPLVDGHMLRRKNRKLCACALGAAYVGRFGKPRRVDGLNHKEHDAVLAEWPNLNTDRLADGTSLFWSIVERNDTKRISREEIADWVESLGY